MRIVIVEDEITIREGMARLIKTHTEHTIAGEGSNGKEGLELILRFKPDLVITDIQMPVMNGLEMIKEIYDLQLHIHTVILSGFSEFEYAKKALQFGVDDYLLKPLAAEDVKELLNKIDERIRGEKQKEQGTRESCIRDILFGYIEENADIHMKIAQTCGFLPDMKYLLIMGYLGAAPATYKNEVDKELRILHSKFPEAHIYSFYQENTRMFYCLSAGYMNLDDLKLCFYIRLINSCKGKREQPVWTEEAFTGLQDLKKTGDNLNAYLTYAITLGGDGWINETAVSRFRPDSYVYPLEITNSLKNSICSSNTEEIHKASKSFLEYFNKHNFDSYNTRQTFFKTYYMISDLLFDFDKGLYEQLKNSNILRLMGEALTRVELETAYLDMIRLLTGQKVKREDISNYTIKKAINYIREHYQESITLEEVSRKLEITPEYLSTLFNRVMEINFSTFLKQFRVSHAKRLLKGTELKIYEVSEKVGYGDPKYFMRVFKEVQGISPGEYRQSN